MCIDIDMRIDMCIDMRIDMHIERCIDMGVGMCLYRCISVCMLMCLHMRINKSYTWGNREHTDMSTSLFHALSRLPRGII